MVNLINSAEQVDEVFVVGDDDQLEVVLARMPRHQLAERGRQRLDVLPVQVGRRLVEAERDGDDLETEALLRQQCCGTATWHK